jgi:ribonuclease HI
MTKFYIDGFTTGSNPATEGGYTITDENGNVLKQRTIKSSQTETLFGKKEVLVTNNYTEFLALYDCLQEFCKDGDTIFTDSKNNISWANLRFPRKSKRRDLIPMAKQVNTLLHNLNIKLEWVSRNDNWAGLVNEGLSLSYANF